MNPLGELLEQVETCRQALAWIERVLRAESAHALPLLTLSRLSVALDEIRSTLAIHADRVDEATGGVL